MSRLTIRPGLVVVMQIKPVGTGHDEGYTGGILEMVSITHDNASTSTWFPPGKNSTPHLASSYHATRQ